MGIRIVKRKKEIDERKSKRKGKSERGKKKGRNVFLKGINKNKQ